MGIAGCENGHRFDETRQGALTLLPTKRRALVADDAAMVDARVRFLGRGHYAPVSDTVAALVASVTVDGVVLDVGSGPGTYLAAALDAAVARDGIALDLSPVAIRRAARASDRIGAVVGDVTERLPILAGTAAVVLDVFAPRNQHEYARVLAPGGLLVVVTPRDGHLAGAPGIIRVDPSKEQRLHASLEPTFERVSSEDLTWTMALDAADVADVVHMGPSHHHVAPDATFPAADVAAAVTVSTWRVR
jgi:23S rRNA (guanine745-N1)-methyltransferase